MKPYSEPQRKVSFSPIVPKSNNAYRQYSPCMTFCGCAILIYPLIYTNGSFGLNINCRLTLITSKLRTNNLSETSNTLARTNIPFLILVSIASLIRLQTIRSVALSLFDYQWRLYKKRSSPLPFCNRAALLPVEVHHIFDCNIFGSSLPCPISIVLLTKDLIQGNL